MIVETLETKAKALGASFLYATKDKANNLLDYMNKLDYPIIVVLPIEITDNKNSSTGALESEFDLTCWVLDKDDQPTTDFDHYLVESSIIVPMRTLARQFITAIDHSDMINEGSNGIEKVKYVAAYGVMDEHLHGVQCTCTVPVIEQLSVCDES